MDALYSRSGEPSTSTTAVNPLRYARRLKAAGVPDHQAEEMADALGNELVEKIATKDDLKDCVATQSGYKLAAAPEKPGCGHRGRVLRTGRRPADCVVRRAQRAIGQQQGHGLRQASIRLGFRWASGTFFA